MSSATLARQEQRRQERLRGAGGREVRRPKFDLGLAPATAAPAQLKTTSSQPAPSAITKDDEPTAGRRRSGRLSGVSSQPEVGEPGGSASKKRRLNSDTTEGLAQDVSSKTSSPNTSAKIAPVVAKNTSIVVLNTPEGERTKSSRTKVLQTSSPPQQEEITTEASRTTSAVATQTPVPRGKRTRQPSPDKFLTPTIPRGRKPKSSKPPDERISPEPENTASSNPFDVLAAEGDETIVSNATPMATSANSRTSTDERRRSTRTAQRVEDESALEFGNIDNDISSNVLDKMMDTDRPQVTALKTKRRSTRLSEGSEADLSTKSIPTTKQKTTRPPPEPIAEDSILPAEPEETVDADDLSADEVENLHEPDAEEVRVEEGDENEQEEEEEEGDQGDQTRQKDKNKLNVQARGRKSKTATKAKARNRSPVAEHEEGERETVEVLLYRLPKTSNFNPRYVAGVSEVNVVHEAVMEILQKIGKTYADKRKQAETTEEKKLNGRLYQVMEAFMGDVDARFIKQAELRDSYRALQADLRRLKIKKAQARNQLLKLRSEGEQTAREMDDVRRTHQVVKDADDKRNDLNERLKDLAIVIESGRAKRIDPSTIGVYTGIEATLNLVTADVSGQRGVLERIKEFNRFLELAQRAIES